MEQNKYTKASVVALVIASILSVVMFMQMLEYFSEAEGIYLMFTLLIPLPICFNLFAAYKIRSGNFRFIKYAFWLYVLQMVGFETSEWAFSLLLGFTFHITWSIEEISLTINLFAVLMSVLLFKAMHSARET